MKIYKFFLAVFVFFVILAVFAMQMERFEAFSTRSSLPATNEPKKAEK